MNPSSNAQGCSACPNRAHMGKFACADKNQCWEPCGELGKSEEHAVVVPESAAQSLNAAVPRPLRAGEAVRALCDIHDGSDSDPPVYLARKGDLLTVAVPQSYMSGTLWVENSSNPKPFRLFFGEYELDTAPAYQNVRRMGLLLAARSMLYAVIGKPAPEQNS